MNPADLAKVQKLFPLSKDTIKRSLDGTSYLPPRQMYHKGMDGSGANPVTVAAPAERRIRQSQKPKMNKLETEALAWLQACYPGNEFKPQAKRYELATGHWYKPDFTTAGKSFSTETAFEVKGPHAFRGGFENLKVAARVWPEVRWILMWKESGVWKQQTILP